MRRADVEASVLCIDTWEQMKIVHTLTGNNIERLEIRMTSGTSF